MIKFHYFDILFLQIGRIGCFVNQLDLLLTQIDRVAQKRPLTGLVKDRNIFTILIGLPDPERPEANLLYLLKANIKR